MESVGDATRTVFHVHDGEVITGEASDLGNGWGEAEEEYSIESFAVLEA